MCANMLECSSMALYKALGKLKSRVEAFGKGRLCLSGSGSAMYHILLGGEEQGSCELTLIEDIGCEYVMVNSNRW